METMPTRTETRSGRSRAYEERPYGRVRMNEAMANRALTILRDQLARDQAAYRIEKDAGEVRPSTRANLNLTKKLLENTEGMAQEKGW